jgi:uncharacterized protein YndB with AHSA1/START domain
MAAPSSGQPAIKKPAAPTPHPVVLADVKMTVRAPLPLVFEALTNPEKVGQWWATDVRIEPEYGGRYEGTLPEGRFEGTITAIDGPSKLSLMWAIPKEGGSTETSIVYELAPKGPQTFVHLIHRSPFPVPGDWAGVWQRALDSLNAFFQGGSENPM